MKQLIIKPDGWPCTLAECPPGHFLHGDHLAFKSEYGDNDAYCDNGEYFVGGAGIEKEKRSQIMVQPVKYEWEEVEA